MDLDVTLIVQAVILLTVLATMGPILLNPVLQVLDLRDKSIAGARLEGVQLLADTKQKEQQLEAQLEGARRQALVERSKLIGEAREAERKLLDSARADAQAQLEVARKTLDESATSVRAKLESTSRELGMTIADKVLSREKVPS